MERVSRVLKASRAALQSSAAIPPPPASDHGHAEHNRSPLHPDPDASPTSPSPRTAYVRKSCTTLPCHPHLLPLTAPLLSRGCPAARKLELRLSHSPHHRPHPRPPCIAIRRHVHALPADAVAPPPCFVVRISTFAAIIHSKDDRRAAGESPGAQGVVRGHIYVRGDEE
ncbi:hypothetical protein BD779DRAFT_1681439 [Infundibulicybe gibba]|nr:hypothetical protein BD779DRAFT_1681439 [Infundibulicybe gibba]